MNAGGGGEKGELATITYRFSFPPWKFQSLHLGEVQMKIHERSLQALISSAPRSRVLARLAQIGGELARRLDFMFLLIDYGKVF